MLGMKPTSSTCASEATLSDRCWVANGHQSVDMFAWAGKRKHVWVTQNVLLIRWQVPTPPSYRLRYVGPRERVVDVCSVIVRAGSSVNHRRPPVYLLQSPNWQLKRSCMKTWSKDKLFRVELMKRSRAVPHFQPGSKDAWLWTSLSPAAGQEK